MKNFFTKILSILLAVNIVLSGNGIKLYQHYCATCNILEISIIKELNEHFCKINKKCNSINECCDNSNRYKSETSENEIKNTDIVENRCCSYETRILKLDVKYLISLNKIFFTDVLLIPNIIFYNFFPVLLKNDFLKSNSLSPPKYQTNLLFIFLCKFII